MGTRYKVGDYVVMVNKKYSHLKNVYKKTGKVIGVVTSRYDGSTAYVVKFPKHKPDMYVNAYEIRKQKK